MRILPSRLSADTPEHSPIDFDQMERDMRQAEQIENSLRQAHGGPERDMRYNAPKPHTALQIIAQSVIALTWAEAEAMGKAITEKGKADGAGGLTVALTAAIQAWAKEWESFDS